MLNPYSIILGLFVLSGLLTSLWGAHIIVRARRTLQWPSVEGRIEESLVRNSHNDLFPHIRYRYRVNNSTFEKELTFPGDVTPSEEFAQYYVDKFPAGTSIKVYYDPEKPDSSTLEPGLAQGDWLVFAIGLGMLIIGILLFVMAG